MLISPRSCHRSNNIFQQNFLHLSDKPLNDFKGLSDDDSLAPFSLVCKAVAADGRPTVKLSDNPNKALGPASEIERYKRVFGVADQTAQPVTV